jgi:hypothetical protein
MIGFDFHRRGMCLRPSSGSRRDRMFIEPDSPKDSELRRSEILRAQLTGTLVRAPEFE